MTRDKARRIMGPLATKAILFSTEFGVKYGAGGSGAGGSGQTEVWGPAGGGAPEPRPYSERSKSGVEGDAARTRSPRQRRY